MKRKIITGLTLSTLVILLWALAACGDRGSSDSGAARSNSTDETQATEPTSVDPRYVVLSDRLVRPWGLAFLQDGRILVTEKRGRMVILSAEGTTVQEALTGLPAVADASQGGLLDVALDPDFTTDPWIYWTYAEPGTGAELGLAGTAVARGRLIGSSLNDVEVIYRQKPKVTGGGHFGSRIAFRSDRTLYVTLGERQKFTPAQDLTTTLGKVIRINRDGSIPPDNPSIIGSEPEIFS